MRTNDERVKAVERRTEELVRQRKERRVRVIGALAAAACIVAIVGLSFYLPGIMAASADGGVASTGMTASIFNQNGSLGYVLIGLLAFMLGISVTILCYRLHRDAVEKKNGQQEEKNGQQGENHRQQEEKNGEKTE